MSVKPTTASPASGAQPNAAAEFQSAATATQARPAPAKLGPQDPASRVKGAGAEPTSQDYVNEARNRANDINWELNNGTDGNVDAMVDGTIASWAEKYSRNDLERIYAELINISYRNDGSQNAGALKLRSALSDYLSQ